MASILHKNKFYLRKLSAWDVVSSLLDNVQRADELTICSFAMAEGFARRLLTERSKIKHLTLILDSTIASRHRSVLLFLGNIADEIYLCNTHAKAVYISSKNYSAIAIMSANATMNFRYESAFITDDKNAVNELKTEIESVKKNAVRFTKD